MRFLTLVLLNGILQTFNPAQAAGVPAKCLAKLNAILDAVESNEDPSIKTSISVPIECQYHHLSDLDTDLAKRIERYLAKNGKTIHSNQKLTEVIGALKYKSIAQQSAPSANGQPAWPPYFYNPSECMDYTGQPLGDCELRNNRYTAEECERLFEYAKRCKNSKRCNPKFKPSSICSDKADFAKP